MSAAVTWIPGGMPSTTTPTPGPWDSPKVVTTNRRPKDDDMLALARPLGGRTSLRRRGALPFRTAPMLGELLLAMGAMSLHHVLELAAVSGPDITTCALHPLLALVPGHDVLARVLEEQLGVKHARIDQCPHHLPIGRHHARVAVVLVVGQIAGLDLVPGERRRADDPGTRGPQLRVPPDLVEPEQQVRVLVGGFAHGSKPPGSTLSAGRRPRRRVRRRARRFHGRGTASRSPRRRRLHSRDVPTPWLTPCPTKGGPSMPMKGTRVAGWLSALVLAAPSPSLASTPARGAPSPDRPVNVIFLIADGCGPASMGLGRAVAGRPLALDSLLVGSLMTHSASSRLT